MKRFVSSVVLGLFLVGCGEAPDPSKVLTFKDRLRLAKEGDLESQNFVALAYLHGTEVSRDLERAMHWFQEAGEGGHSQALYNLGILHQEGKFIQQDHEKAFGYYLKAARRGLPEAQMSLGWLYEGGLGTVKNMKEAVYWYQRAATYGKAADRARSYYSKNLLAHRDTQYLYGNIDAQFLLGKLFETGNEHLDADLNMAVEWYEDAAVRGDGASASRLAVLLGLKGTPRSDPVMGYAWAKVAMASKAPQEIEQILGSIQRRLNPAQLAEGDSRTSALLELVQYNQTQL